MTSSPQDSEDENDNSQQASKDHMTVNDALDESSDSKLEKSDDTLSHQQDGWSIFM